jgi:hypothetical protein
MILEVRGMNEKLGGAIAETKWSKMVSSCQIVPEEEISEIVTGYSNDSRK